jgi:hypothetical protein
MTFEAFLGLAIPVILSSISAVVVVLVTNILNKRKQNSESKKLDAESIKIKAEADKTSGEAWQQYSNKIESKLSDILTKS